MDCHATPYRYDGTDSEYQFGFQKKGRLILENSSYPKIDEVENTWITMPDGCRLAARICLPEGAETEPVPAILEYIPYRKRDFTAVSFARSWNEMIPRRLV